MNRVSNISKQCVVLCLIAFTLSNVKLHGQTLITESFDGTTFPPAGWSTLVTTTGNTWTRVTAGTNPTNTPHSGAGEAKFNSYSGTGVTSLVTPALNFSLAGIREVSFWMYRDAAYLTYADRINVLIGTTNNAAGLAAATLIGTVNRSTSLTPVVASEGWYQYTFTVPDSYNSAANYIFFKGTSTAGNNIFIDDITVKNLTPCSGTPNGGVATTSGCISHTNTVSIIGNTGIGGFSYQWQSSPSTTGPWTNIPNAIGATYTTSVTVDLYYRRITTCTSSGLSANSTAVQMTVADCGPPPCGPNIPAGDFCGMATPICNLAGYCGNTSSDYTVDEPGNLGSLFCGSIDNNSWIKFIAGDVTATLNVFVSNCENNDGIQMQIFGTSDCITYVSRSNCWNPTVMEDGTITATNLTVGNTYYLMIDGYAGDVCDYVISASAGSGVLLANAGPDVTICKGESTQLNASGGLQFDWQPESSLSNSIIQSPIATPDTTTTYTLTVIGGSPLCPSSLTDQVTVTVISTTATASVNSPICAGVTLNMTSLPDSGTVYNWSGPDNFSSNVQNPSITNTTTAASGIYTVSVTALNGCSDTVQIEATVNPLPTPQIINNSNITVLTCSLPSISVTATGGQIYLWSGGTTPSTDINSFENPGTYTVTVTSAEGCTETTSITISQDLSVTAAIVNNTGGITQLTNDLTAINVTATGGVSYEWSNGSTNAYTSFTNPGTYTVTVTAANGCIDTTSIVITQHLTPEFFFYIANSFTPNGDGINDVFKPSGLGYNANGYEMYIFDRWGELVFYSNQFDKGWDGKFQGDKLNVNSIFIYQIVVYDQKTTKGNPHLYTGQVTLLGSEKMK